MHWLQMFFEYMKWLRKIGKPWDAEGGNTVNYILIGILSLTSLICGWRRL